MSHSHFTSSAFGETFEEYSDALFRHCYFRVADRERALELVQDTFMKTWKYIAEGKEINNIKAFLYRTLNNLIIDEYRKHHSVSLDALLEQEDVSEGDFETLIDDPREGMELRLDAQSLSGVLQQLPALYRDVITLRFIDGLSPQEIAEVLKESENTVSVRIHRGLKKLRSLLHYNE